MNRRHALRSHESGSVLITGLLTLIVLTAIGLMASRSSIIENEIVGNERDYTQAFYVAEVGLEAAEHLIDYEIQDADSLPTGKGYAPPVTEHKDDADTPDIVQRKTTEALIASSKASCDDTHPASIPIASQPLLVEQKPCTTMWPLFRPDSSGIGTTQKKGDNFFVVVSNGTGTKKDAEASLKSIFTRNLGR